MGSTAEPVSRRERPAKPALTRAGIVAAALAVIRADAVERVTMRRLAKELDTGPASLYVYFHDTDELHAAVLDALLAEVDLSSVTAPGPWRDRLSAVLGSYQQLLYAHPSLARTAVVTRPNGPNYLALIEALLSLLDAGEVPGDRAAWLVDLLLLITTASAAEHGSRAASQRTEIEDDAMVVAVREASAETYPRLAALSEELLSGAGNSRARWAIDVLLAGVVRTPRPE